MAGSRDQPTRGRRILLVDDSAAFRRALADFFGQAGYEPHEVADGQAALQGFTTLEPDIVLLDVRLPGLSGLDLCAKIREMSTVPIIVLSGIGELEEKLAAFERGRRAVYVRDRTVNLTARDCHCSGLWIRV